MKTRVITSVFIGAVLIAVLMLSETPIYSIALSVLAVMAVSEIMRAYSLSDKYSLSVPAYIIAAVMPTLAYVMKRMFDIEESKFIIVLALALFVYMIYLFVVAVFMKGALEFATLSAGFVLVMYITACFSALSVIRYTSEAGLFNVGMVFIGAWISDIFAYFSGRLFGKHKLIPEVSPKKTVEGSIGAIISTAVLMTVYGLLVSAFTDLTPKYLVLAISGVVLSVVGQIGDLIASFVKRERGIKDYGTLLPGHGGIMDRFDSILTVSGATMIIVLLFAPFT